MEKSTDNPIYTPIAIIGGGFGALLTYAILRFRGLPHTSIRIYSASNHPTANWYTSAATIRQRAMRSESTGHFLPTDAPGLATIESLRKRSLVPIIRTWFDTYHPTIDTILNHAHTVASQVGFHKSHVATHITRITKANSIFNLFDDTQSCIGQASHVIMAIGHGTMRMPKPLTQYLEQHPEAPIYHSFAPKPYQPQEHVLVVGDGLTAATEWMNILESGSCVTAVSIQGFNFTQDLNTPRRYFSKRGLRPYHAQTDSAHLQELTEATRGTIPPYYWRGMFKQPYKQGQLKLIQGELVDIVHHDIDGLHCKIKLATNTYTYLTVDKIISAAGFMPTTTNPLITQLITEYSLPTTNGYIKTDADGIISQLSDNSSILGIVGPGAAWAIPSADSIVGMRLTARKIVNRILGHESYNMSHLKDRLANWSRLVTGKELI